MPSSDRQTALDLYKSSVELEAELRQLSKQKPPFDKQVATVRTKLRENYERIIFLDYEFAQSKEVEQNLWKYVYYKFIEEFRKRIRTAVTTGGKSKSIHRKLTSSFRSFLQEATGFYYSFIQRLAVHFELKQLDPIIKKFGLTIESTNASQHSYSDDIKQKAVLSCHKSLIFLGDLARYRELQTEKPRKNWSTACDYYNHARHLVPESGNPHNQLAVIATYSADEFSAVYHYYRSLVVRCPFLTAKDNISLLFHKARKSSADAQEKGQGTPQRDHKENGSRRRFSHQRQVPSAAQSAKVRADEATHAFFSDFIRLHSILYFRTDLESYSELKASVLNQLRESVLTLALDPDQLLKFTAINMAASFAIRNIVNGDSNNVNQSPKASISYSTTSKKALVEKYAILLTLDSLSTLLEMCNSELLDVAVECSDQRHNAVQILPAPVKRSLISLRVGTKWVYSSLELLTSMSALIAKDPNVKNEVANIAKFWQRFAEFLNSLERLFPHDKGIPLDVPLAEDFELNGFSGLKNNIFVNEQNFLNQGEPFEELDMRIYDIFEDAYKISESEFSQLFYVDGVFSSGTPPSKAASPASSLSPVQNQITDQSYVEDKVEAPDLITDPYETNLAESQSFASSSPKKLTNDSSEDDDAEEEVILFTGRHSSVIENGNTNGTVNSEKTSPRPTAAEVLLSQVLKSNKPVPSTLPVTNSINESNYWNQFNTTQLFPNSNLNAENVEAKSAKQNSLEFLYPVTRPPTNMNGNTGAYAQAPFSTHTTISGVPNASQDPLVPSTKRLSGEFKPITPHQQATTISSASLFAFPGTDGGVSQFGLFGDPNTSLLGFGTPGHTYAKSSLSVINPPPGFSSESNAFDLHKHSQQNNHSLFQPSNVFGFSSFDMSTQFPWKQGE
ncbi:20194_t:CDS:10 [Dentiscutata erythropus]|uniref:20194_t:CDS:1 n=1 Tax=Dentiscutata erythropus TaxID=1348616 RepID=A0A9N9DM96_9GLOM|nr:20194_t:CDS:10 [Dentiscutata erythropus]